MTASPAPVTRDGARDAARDELSRPEYHHGHRNVLQRTRDWLGDRYDDLFGNSSTRGHGVVPTWLSVVIAVLLIIIVVAVIAVAVQRLGNPVRRRDEQPLQAGPASSRDLREQAQEHAAAGRYSEAVRDRLRAVAQLLTERAVLGPKPGRTAAELAADVRTTPAAPAAPALRRAADVFDRTWYGRQRATPEGYALVAVADDQVQAALAGRATQTGADGAEGYVAVPS